MDEVDDQNSLMSVLILDGFNFNETDITEQRDDERGSAVYGDSAYSEDEDIGDATQYYSDQSEEGSNQEGYEYDSGRLRRLADSLLIHNTQQYYYCTAPEHRWLSDSDLMIDGVVAIVTCRCFHPEHRKRLKGELKKMNRICETAISEIPPNVKPWEREQLRKLGEKVKMLYESAYDEARAIFMMQKYHENEDYCKFCQYVARALLSPLHYRNFLDRETILRVHVLTRKEIVLEKVGYTECLYSQVHQLHSNRDNSKIRKVLEPLIQ
ncbi:hypothetical protein DL89DRAFT_269526 [Linderina pennispora]|uniref:Uncharacterized protein n=1 Tax=Linderina pennispora TaxID=61395 RepID=A0A1Y1W0Q5_9FUNG|nr:uncharacterized protein DL89DRAFT_269526 [Linderina pennispora]ORX67087.1 hypothetical protein DL89DRAFT_269526 [Linderina pennispora]